MFVHTHAPSVARSGRHGRRLGASPPPLGRPAVAARGWFGGGGAHERSAAAAPSPPPPASLAGQPSALPASHDQAIRQSQLATERALDAGLRLLEIDFPPVSISAVAGDGDGQAEMNQNLRHLRRFLGASSFRDRASRVRVLFGDPSEAAVAMSGATMDPAAGRAKTEPAFPRGVPGEPPFSLGHLTRPNAIWSLTGVNFDGWSPAGQVDDTDEVLVVAYPTFNAKEELGAARAVWDAKCETEARRAMIVFNGELEKLREGYYPPLFFRDLARIADEWLPRMETVYSVRNFRGSRPAALVRSYPGDWTLYRRDPLAEDDEEDSAASAVAVWSSSRRPSLREVATELIPNSDRALAEALAGRGGGGGGARR